MAMWAALQTSMPAAIVWAEPPGSLHVLSIAMMSSAAKHSRTSAETA
jgi:hypothetical protein